MGLIADFIRRIQVLHPEAQHLRPGNPLPKLGSRDCAFPVNLSHYHRDFAVWTDVFVVALPYNLESRLHLGLVFLCQT